ncbi:MAG: ABC transporter ATP-binding protein [Culicoidibacterales bacterium]
MLQFTNINKVYTIGEQTVRALSAVDFTIEKGEFTIILGPSGSGKSTLLNILGGMDRATDGTFMFDNTDVTQLTDHQLSNYRRDKVGFVFQFYNLIPSLTALENVAIAAQLSGNGLRAEDFLEKVGLKERMNNFPNQMSGGEMQRVSIARALAKEPELLLCDEPTGALDSKTGMKILDLLRESAKKFNTAVVMVTHNAEFAQTADKVIRLHDGEIAAIEYNEHPVAVMEVI